MRRMRPWPARNGAASSVTILSSYVSPEVIAACTDGGVHQREYKQGLQYSAHCDPSGARGDSFTCAIGHVEKGVGILDLLLEAKPPFSPESVVQEFCDMLKLYHIAVVHGDKWGAEFVQEMFRKRGIRYIEADCSTSDYFAGFLPILTSSRVRLLDHRKLASQLCGLERRTSRVGAKDAIGHGTGGHDDLATSVAGLMVRVVTKKGPMQISDELLSRSAQPTRFGRGRPCFTPGPLGMSGSFSDRWGH